MDTINKRAAMIVLNQPWMASLPIADGTLSLADAQQLLADYPFSPDPGGGGGSSILSGMMTAVIAVIGARRRLSSSRS